MRRKRAARQDWERGSGSSVHTASRCVQHPGARSILVRTASQCVQHPGAHSIPQQGVRRRLPYPCLQTGEVGAQARHEEGLLMRHEQMEQMDPETPRTGPPAPTSPSNPVLSSLELSLVGSGAPRAPPVPRGIAKPCRGPGNGDACVPHASLGTTRAIGLFTTAGQSRLRGNIGAAPAAFPARQHQSQRWPGKISFGPPSSHAIPLSQQA